MVDGAAAAPAAAKAVIAAKTAVPAINRDNVPKAANPTKVARIVANLAVRATTAVNVVGAGAADVAVFAAKAAVRAAAEIAAHVPKASRAAVLSNENR